MLTVYFKNGLSVNITQEIANVLSDKLISGGANDFQIFHEDGQCCLILKLSEVIYIIANN
jgi:hypothetical protein